ncbi:MAG: MATE family efflux transporter [Colwellia sp.]|jgi:Na+-driven multidrug efflux pump
MKSIFLLALTISFTRLISLSMPLVDIVMLSNYNSDQLASYIIGSQLPQLFLVISMGLLVGINIIIPKNMNLQTNTVSNILLYASLISFFSIAILLPLDFLFNTKSEIGVKDILSSGLPFIIIYFSASSILEASGRQNTVLILALIASTLNPMLNYILLNYTNAWFQESYSISISTSIIRFLLMSGSLYMIYKHVYKGNNIASPEKYVPQLKELFRIGLPEAFSRGLFCLSIVFLSFYISNTKPDNYIALFGMSLNILNTLSVFFIGIAISLTIKIGQFKTKENYQITNALTLSIKTNMPFIIFFILIGIFSTTFIAKLYTGTSSVLFIDFKNLVPYCIAVIILDSIAINLTAILRVYNDAKYPPLMKMASFVFISIPLSIYLLDDYSILGVLYAFLIGHAVAIFVLCLKLLTHITAGYSPPTSDCNKIIKSNV